MAAEIHQRHIEEEKETPPVDSKEKSPQSGTNKKAKKEKEAPKKKKAEKKGKGIHGTGTRYPGHFKPLCSKGAFNQVHSPLSRGASHCFKLWLQLANHFAYEHHLIHLSE